MIDVATIRALIRDVASVRSNHLQGPWRAIVLNAATEVLTKGCLTLNSLQGPAKDEMGSLLHDLGSALYDESQHTKLD